MKKGFLILILFSVFTNAQNTNKMITKLVNENVIHFLEKIPLGKEKLYGFDNRSDFQSCISGKPIQVLTLDKNTILVKQNIWRIPIVLNGENKILFTVNIINNQFKIVDIGGIALAKELQQHQSTNNLYLLRLYSNHIDFISSTKGEVDLNNMDFTPLESSKFFIKKATNSIEKSVFSIDEIKELIK